MKKPILFRNLWNGSTFEFEGKFFRKISDAFSISVVDGKQSILLGKDKVTPVNHMTVRFK